ncbi:MAG: AMP-binding protein, partial [Candidatus Binataceae bacterium]
LEHALNDSRARALLLEEQFIPIYQAIAPNIGWKLTVIAAGTDSAPFQNFDSFVAGQLPELAPEPMSPDDMAFWIYTSGTTGTPKAAVHLQHDVLSAGPHLAYLDTRPGDRYFSISRLFFAYALGNCLFGSLRLCGTTILHPAWPDVESAARVIAETRPDFVFSVPTMYRNILRSGRAEEPGFKSARAYVSAGERLPAALAETWRRATGVRIYEGMGTSETIYMILTNSPDAYRPGASGRVAPGAEVKLIDEDEKPISEPNRPGVLWVRMDSRCDRYWNQRENSNRAFFGPWFRTGDMYSFDEDGFYYQHGRADEMLKISGQWVSPMEIEECAMALPLVADAALIGLPNDDGLVRLSLFLVARGAGDPEHIAAEVREMLVKTLSVYKCPRDIRFVERLPRTATGKLQRYILRQQIIAAPGGARRTCS